MSSRVNVMRAITGRSGEANDRVLSFYMCTVHSRLDYAAPCLLTVGPASLHLLETVQNSALRTLLGAPLWMKCICLRVEAFVCNVAERVAQLGVGHLVTLLRREGSDAPRGESEECPTGPSSLSSADVGVPGRSKVRRGWTSDF